MVTWLGGVVLVGSFSSIHESNLLAQSRSCGKHVQSLLSSQHDYARARCLSRNSGVNSRETLKEYNLDEGEEIRGTNVHGHTAHNLQRAPTADDRDDDDGAEAPDAALRVDVRDGSDGDDAEELLSNLMVAVKGGDFRFKSEVTATSTFLRASCFYHSPTFSNAVPTLILTTCRGRRRLRT